MHNRLLLAILFSFSLHSETIPNLLNENYNNLYNLKEKKELSQKEYDISRFIAPLNLNVERKFSYLYKDKSSVYNQYSITIDQPIFKFGGIYYGIKFAKIKYKTNKLKINKEKKELIIQAIKLAYEIKSLLYEKKKVLLNIKNKEIELAMYEKILESGYISSLDIDDLLVELSEAKEKLYDIKINLKQKIHQFKQISYKNPYKIKLPKLKLISKNKFLKNNYNLQLAKKNIELSKYRKKMVSAKYLPTISVSLEYGKISSHNTNYRSNYKEIGLKMTMPISASKKYDKEIAKLEYLISKLELINTKNETLNSYESIKNSFLLYNKKRQLIKEQLRIYNKLLRKIKKLQKAGEKNNLDLITVQNYIQIKKYDLKILNMQKQILLLELYKNSNI